MSLHDANLVAALVTAVVMMIIGMLWYGPLFGKIWMRNTGMTEAKAKKVNMSLIMPIALVSSTLMAAVLQMLLVHFNLLEMNAALMFAFWLWLGFFATSNLGVVLWEQKKMELYYVNAGYNLVTLLVMAAILSSWV